MFDHAVDPFLHDVVLSVKKRTGEALVTWEGVDASETVGKKVFEIHLLDQRETQHAHEDKSCAQLVGKQLHQASDKSLGPRRRRRHIRLGSRSRRRRRRLLLGRVDSLALAGVLI